ncbi:BQ5605_C013g07082 [Microbotryum silenes-dioicae]|uniref:BQ5605_C013g07082 protein n=1 Tax=Microbotryum silenes-dioicae TaxID=796604 RepID=A0A2X0LQV4_9BASI|nr:BQ5605_C013g07082 [Microbotryum silenes-dioicae]
MCEYGQFRRKLVTAHCKPSLARRLRSRRRRKLLNRRRDQGFHLLANVCYIAIRPPQNRMPASI